MLGHVTIVGCGLIGGSLVKRLRERTAAQRISAIDREEVLALARSYLDGAAIPGSPSAARLVAESDLIVLATPVGTIVRDLSWVLDRIRPDAVVTDAGSVKQPIVEMAARHAKGARFVGGHPMAGREVGGFEASSPDLFSGVRWFIVAGSAPSNATPDAPGATVRLAYSDAIARVVELIGFIGAEPRFVDAEAHDRAMAYLSHAPQLVASALYVAAARAGVVGDGGPGFRDVTRIAGGPSAMWRDILEANRRRIATALEDVLRPLIELQRALAQEGETDVMDLVDLLEKAQTARAAASPDRPPREST
jgi:prephenate dehydrogenase